MPPPSISFTSFPVFNFPDRYPASPPLRSQVMWAQANPRPGDSRTATDATPVPPSPPQAVYSLSQLVTARQERDRLFNDASLLGPQLERWNSARNSLYQNVSLSILRMRYFLQASQTDTSSILFALQPLYHGPSSASDPLFREVWQRVRAALSSLREAPNRERAEVLLRLMDQVEASGPPSWPISPPPADRTSPPSVDVAPPTTLTPTPPVGSGAVTPPTAPVVPPSSSMVPTVRPVSFTSTSREVGSGDAFMRDLRDHAVRSARQAAERYGRSHGRSIDLTLQLHIQYNTDGAGTVFARQFAGTDPAFVQQILQAVARDLPRFRGHGGDAVEVPLHFSLQ